MAYADSIRAATATTEEIASLIEGLLIGTATVTSVTHSTAISTTSLTFVDVTSTSASVSIASGQSVLLLAHMTFSHGTANEAVEIQFLEDSTGLAYSIGRAYRANSGGQDTPMSLFTIRTPAAGTRTFKLQWRTTAGTAYCRRSVIVVVPFQAS